MMCLPLQVPISALFPEPRRGVVRAEEKETGIADYIGSQSVFKAICVLCS